MSSHLGHTRTHYATWYAFKKDLEFKLWCHLENALWLKIKPKKRLPWHGADMETALSRILRY